jgi:aminoglycoside phosphotransferase family enzyme/adenylate kinase family enzyme
MKPGEITQDQGATIAFLQALAEREGGSPERIDTHAAIVFLAGGTAWKLKRAVWFPFLDFATLEKRRAACEAEVRLNRRTAPDIYLGCQPITRGTDGTLALGGEGEAIDWVVVMRRFDQDLLFDRMAERGALTADHITELADEIAEFHGAAGQRAEFGGAEAIRWIVEDDIAEMASMPETFGETAVGTLKHLSDDALAKCAELLDERREAGFVRHCHGDLHLRNIFLWKGRPTLFDCLEFDENLACIDVLYDLAFLLMDLEHRGRGDFANLAVNRYLQRTGDLGGLAALPLFLSCRAAIRAKVEASGATMQRDEAEADGMRAAARDYLSLATAFLAPHAPMLIGIGGESGSGKSTIAAAAAPRLGGAPGALILRSDVTRKRLFGRLMEEPLPQEAYGKEATARTFGRLIEDAKIALAAGMTVIADAVYAVPAERDALEQAARDAGASFHGFWIDVPLEVRIERVSGRRGDASDATVDFLRAHPTREQGPMGWTRIDASGTVDEVVERLLDKV